MQPAYRILPAVALALLSASSFAATTVYTSSATFLSQIAPGFSFTQNFDGLSDPVPGPVAFSGGTFAYAASAPSNIYLAGGFLGTSQINEALTINFTSGNITAVGANFYVTDISDTFQPVSVTITLGDGTVETFTPTSIANSYRGFTSNLLITSLVISGPGASLYAGLDNLTVGAVPEPDRLAMLGLGLAGLLVARRRGKQG